MVDMIGLILNIIGIPLAGFSFFFPYKGTSHFASGALNAGGPTITSEYKRWLLRVRILGAIGTLFIFTGTVLLGKDVLIHLLKSL